MTSMQTVDQSPPRDEELNNPPGIGQTTDEAAQLRTFSRREPTHRPPPPSRVAVMRNQTEPWTATTA